MNKRVLFSNNGTIEDFSFAMDEYRGDGKDFPFVASEDALYIGSRLPFNHIYFKLKRFNFIDSKLSATYWDGSNWVEFVELTDETNGFKQSGFLTFTPDREKLWMMDSTNYDGEIVEGLESVVIYDLYWVKITFENTLVGPEVVPATDPVTYEPVSIQWCGNIFASDFDLAGEYPDFVRPNVMKVWPGGNGLKTDWQEQHAIAAKILIADLINKAVVDDGSQLLNRSDYTLAAVHKAAEIICTGFGDDYIDMRKSAREEYQQRINKRVQRVDVNKNGREDKFERDNTTGWFGR